MSNRILQSVGLLAFTLISAIASLFAIDRVMPSPLVFLPILSAIPSIMLGTFLASQRSSSQAAAALASRKAAATAPRLRSIVFVSPVAIRSPVPSKPAGFARS